MTGSAGLRARDRMLRDLDSFLPIAPVTPDKGKGVVHPGKEKESDVGREETKRKRYRPKVIREGRPAKTPKRATETPRPVTPAAREDNLWKDISCSSVSPSATCTAAACSTHKAKSSRRSLNFDSVSEDTGFENQGTCPMLGELGPDRKKGIASGDEYPRFSYVYQKRRTRKDLDHCQNSILSNDKGPPTSAILSSLGRIVEEDNLNQLPKGNIQDIESLDACNCSRAIVPYGDPVDDSVLNLTLPFSLADQQHALILRSGSVFRVSNRKKKGQPTPKVDLDEETIRACNFLMGPEGIEGDRGFDADSELEKEQKLFHKRVNLFIARMHQVQGDRSFSQWKGSVVDSVVGAFLTQNVSDHQSSSAFMALAAKFPLKLGGKKVKLKTWKKSVDRNAVRKKGRCNRAKKERSRDRRDSLDWEAVKSASISEVSKTIETRGMNNKLAKRIKRFLARLAKDHGSIDLEWLRDVPLSKAKQYLLGIEGLGLKSVECICLLALSQIAFPVDTNVGRICVRLGWVPLETQPESILIHELKQYPLINTIQKYLWPRLCKLDQRTLYELHYQMITFGKVFCRKRNPNCNACPMRGDCKHFASAYASDRLLLPRPEEISVAGLMLPHTSENNSDPILSPQINERQFHQNGTVSGNCEPFLEEPASPELECKGTVENAMKDAIKPASPEPECTGTGEIDMEDAFLEYPDEIPTIKLNLEDFKENLQELMHANGMGFRDGDMSKAIVAIAPEDASVPSPILKNVSRLRTEHLVYQLPDSHPLLDSMDKREPGDPCPYLLAIWTRGETAESNVPPESCCSSRDMGGFCNEKTFVTCNNVSEVGSQTVKATILIPCRTAMRGSFPLNGTYFQVNELFADHESSYTPIDVSRESIWNLKRRTVYFGTSTQAIFKGLGIKPIQQGFWKGFVCVRGFDRRTRSPRPLHNRLHFNGNKKTSVKEQ